MAQRVVDLITRARARLDHDLSRVLLQQGEDPNATAIPVTPTVSVPRRNLVQEVKETLRAPRETTPVVSVVSAPIQVIGNKSEVLPRRFLIRVPMLHPGRRAAGGTTSGSTGYGSPAPSTGYTGTGIQRSARLAASDYNHSARPSPIPRRQTPSVEADEDGEGEEEDSTEDKNLYCLCQKLSYGTVSIGRPRCSHPRLTIGRVQMVGCDNTECSYQWVMFIPVPCGPPVVLNSFFSSI